MGKGADWGPTKEKGFSTLKQMPDVQRGGKFRPLFLHCPLIWRFWALLTALSGVEWVCPLRIKDLMMGWSTFFMRKEAKKLWKTALSSLLWAVWKERNRVTFDNLNFSQDRIKQSFISSITSWAG